MSQTLFNSIIWRPIVVLCTLNVESSKRKTQTPNLLSLKETYLFLPGPIPTHLVSPLTGRPSPSKQSTKSSTRPAKTAASAFTCASSACPGSPSTKPFGACCGSTFSVLSTCWCIWCLSRSVASLIMFTKD
jgi:hypothetical protein